jgi:3-oxoacyl-[acyl-carrier protein] reductase
MTRRLEGKRALVTGGSRGIGAAIARRLAAEGADVVITYAGNHEGADATVAAIVAEGGKSVAIQANAADPAAVRIAVDQAAATLGGIDILVHNAGVAEFHTVDGDDSLDHFRKTFGINVEGVFVGTLAAVPHLADGGRVILIGSVVGHASPFAGIGVYAASKAAVASFARSWSRDLGGRGILVNAIQPGPIATDMNPDEGEFAATMRELTPLKRYGKPEEVAALAAFLASDDASYITGTAIDIAGGAFV